MGMAMEDTRRRAGRLTVTDVTAVEHLVTDAVMAAGRRAGRYAAACGAEVLAASRTAPESSRCQRCRAVRAGDRSD
jgi:hypothetical protein